MRLASAGAVLALAACGGSDGLVYPFTCTVPDYALVELQKDTSCDAVRERFEISARLLVAGGVATAEEVRRIRTATAHVRVRDTIAWQDPVTGKRVSGMTRLYEGIVTSSNLGTLLHEELHTIENNRASLTTAQHIGWNGSGFWGLDDFYMFTAAGQVNCTPRGPLTTEQADALRAEGWPVDAWLAPRVEGECG